MARNRPGIGPYSRLLARGSVDGRSREGRYLAAVKKSLSEHVGGNPTIAEKLLIDRIARMALRLELLEDKIATGTVTAHDGHIFGALNNALRLALREIGLKSPVSRPAMSLADRYRPQQT